MAKPLCVAPACWRDSFEPPFSMDLLASEVEASLPHARAAARREAGRTPKQKPTIRQGPNTHFVHFRFMTSPFAFLVELVTRRLSLFLRPSNVDVERKIKIAFVRVTSVTDGVH